MNSLLRQASIRSSAWSLSCASARQGLSYYRSPSSTQGSRPWMLPFMTSAGLVLTLTAYLYHKSGDNETVFHMTHLDSLVDKDRSLPLTLPFAANVSLDPPGQATTGSVVTPLTCLFLWGSNRYRVADPNSPRLHVPFPTPLFLDSTNLFNEKAAMPDSSDLAKLCKLYGSRVRSVALSEKHAAAIDGQGNLFQWGTGFFKMSQNTLNIQFEQDNHSTGLMALVHHDSASPLPSSNLEITSSAASPTRLDGTTDFRPVRTLQGKNLTRVASTLDYTFAMNDANELWMCPAVLPVINSDASLRVPVKLTLPFSKAEKLVQIAAGDAHLLLLTDKGAVYTTPVTSNGNFYGQCGLDVSAMDSGPARALLESLPSYHAPLSMRDPVHDQLKTSQQHDSDHDDHGRHRHHRTHHLEEPVAKPLPFLPISMLNLTEKTSQIACGSHHSLLLSANSNSVYGFGSNLSSQLGISSRLYSDSSVSSLSPEKERVKDMHVLTRPVQLELMVGTSKESIDPFAGFVTTDPSAAGGHREHYTKYATGSPESAQALSGGLAPASSHISHPDELKERLRLVRYPLHQRFKIRNVFAGGFNSGFLAQSLSNDHDALFICGQGLQGQYGDGHIRHAQPELGQVKGLGDTKYYDESSHTLKSIPISSVSIGKSHLAASLEAHGVDHIRDSQAMTSKMRLPRFGSSLFMWGSNLHYNLGNGRRATSYVPIQPLSFPFIHDDYELYLEKEKLDSESNSSPSTAFLTLEQLFRRHHYPQHATNVVHDVGLQLFPGLYKKTIGQEGLEEILPAQTFVCGHDASAIY